ncbi:porin family protein [Hymenobacter jeollabukensis]|uniref:PorT family protein n=1 Tax=Hymenobacter jeollabukensis TaxID=2025313 RepID=A0A5R8WU50_9BACT|nr:porin family protein [Hymenobacter jeollabukensis]TLM95302.1 PorT family protein [Hymenobacter jeollabukensis]
MKRVLIAAGLLLAAAPAWAQSKTCFGLKAGLSRSTLSGVVNASPKWLNSVVAGGMVRFKPTSQNFAVQLEANLSSQGARIEYIQMTGGGNYYIASDKRNSMYLNVPVLLRQYIGPGLYLNVGPQLGVLLGDSNDAYKSDVAAVGGIGWESPTGWMLDGRLNYGLTSIDNDKDSQALRDRAGLGGLHNRVLQLSVGKLFGKKPAAR